jgi:hypothetical protein
MFGFMKKKEDDGFKLDESKLPSLSDTNSNAPFPEENIPPTSDLPQTPAPVNPQDDPFAVPDDHPDRDLYNQARDYTPESAMTRAGNPTNLGASPNSNFMPNQQQKMPEAQDGNQQVTNLHPELLMAKIESMESRMTLLDAKISNQNQKLELIYQLIMNEVSEDTKRKLKVQSMAQDIKQ